MTKQKISVLIRCKNESEWLPFLLDSLEKQVSVEYSSILILDNNSDDEPECLAPLYPHLPVKFINLFSSISARPDVKLWHKFFAKGGRSRLYINN